MMKVETSPQMRRSISMPVKPEHLEQETLKRSAEKETVFATTDEESSSYTDAEEEDNSVVALNYQQKQKRSIASTLTVINNDVDNTHPTDNETGGGNDEDTEKSKIAENSTKTFRVRDFFNPIFALFRKATTTTPTTTETATLNGLNNNHKTTNRIEHFCNATPNVNICKFHGAANECNAAATLSSSTNLTCQLENLENQATSCISNTNCNVAHQTLQQQTTINEQQQQQHDPKMPSFNNFNIGEMAIEVQSNSNSLQHSQSNGQEKEKVTFSLT